MPRMPRFARAAHFVEVLTLKMPANAVLPGSGSTRAGGKRRRDRCWSETVERSEESPKEKGPNNAGENRGSQLQNPGKTVLAFLRFFLELMIQDVRLKYV